jgi:hypothetical protein
MNSKVFGMNDYKDYLNMNSKVFGMNDYKDYLIESLDDSYEIARNENRRPTTLDEWVFEVNNTSHAFRFNRAPEFGKRVAYADYGVKRGMRLIRKVQGVGPIRKYLATVISAAEQSLQDPTDKLKMRMQGIILTFPIEIADKMGTRLKRIIIRRFKLTHAVSKEFITINENIVGLFLVRRGFTFKTVFDKYHANLEEDEESASVDAVVSDVKPVRPTRPTRPQPKGKISTDVAATKSIAMQSVASAPQSKYVATASDPVTPDIEEMDDEVKPTIDYEYPEVVLEPESHKTTSTVKEFVSKERKMENLLKLVGGKKVSFTGVTGPFAAAIEMQWSGVDMTEEEFSDYLGSYMNGNEMYGSVHIVGILDSLGVLLPKKYSSRDSMRENNRDEWATAEQVAPKVKGAGAVDPLNTELPPLKANVNWSVISKATKNIQKAFSEFWGGFIPASMAYRGIHFREDELLASQWAKKINLQKAVASTIASMPLLYEISPTKTVKSGNGSKTYRVDYPEERTRVHDSSLTALTITKPFDVREWAELQDNIPPVMQDSLFVDDPDRFEVGFIHSWALAGGSYAQELAAKVLSKFGVNEKLSNMYSPENFESEDDKKIEHFNDRILSNFEVIYEKSQQFFKEKFKKRYQDKHIKLYRGVALPGIGSYRPGAIESWSTNLSTAKRFASMMSGYKKEPYVLYAEVPIQHIFGSYESFVDTFPGEEDLKGKKEYMVMGGTFSTTPMYLLDIQTKGTTLLTVREWLSEDIDMNKVVKQVEISKNKGKPTEKEALGIDPREYEFRGLTDEAKQRQSQDSNNEE